MCECCDHKDAEVITYNNEEILNCTVRHKYEVLSIRIYGDVDELYSKWCKRLNEIVKKGEFLYKIHTIWQSASNHITVSCKYEDD